MSNLPTLSNKEHSGIYSFQKASDVSEYYSLGWKKTLKRRPFKANNDAPVKKGIVRLTVSNMYPARVGAMVRKLIRAKLLTPMAVAVSWGFTIATAKVCLMGIENSITIRNAINKMMATIGAVTKEKTTARLAVTSREMTSAWTSPRRLTTGGTNT